LNTKSSELIRGEW